jgi:predicted phage terminase large subunit-like protein
MIVLPRLHPAQIAIVDTPGRFKCIAAGRRFGKGILGVSEAFKRGLSGKKCRWIAPSYASDSYQAGWSMAVNLARQIPGVMTHLQRRAFDFTSLGGQWLQFRTAEEPDSLRGEGIDFAIFDEAAHIKGLQDLWEQAVRPSLMDRKGGAWFITTPKGFNYFNELYKRAEDGDAEWASFHYSTKDNPTIEPSEIEALKKDMPSLVARQEIDAEFIQLAGALFKRENVRVLEREPEGVAWVRAWDLAFTEKTTSDFTAGGRMGVTSDGTVILADVVHGRMEWPAVVRLISDTARSDGYAVRQGIETVAAQVGMLQSLMSDPLLVAYTFQAIEIHRDKVTRALPLIARAEQGKFAIVRGSWNKKFLDELSSFPEGQHDDLVDMATSGMQMLTEPTGAWDAAAIAGSSTGYRLPEGDAGLDPISYVDATEE